MKCEKTRLALDEIQAELKAGELNEGGAAFAGETPAELRATQLCLEFLVSVHVDDGRISSERLRALDESLGHLGEDHLGKLKAVQAFVYGKAYGFPEEKEGEQHRIRAEIAALG